MREMKDSGIDWIGEIPKDWEFIPSKYLFHEMKTQRYSNDIRMTSSVKYGIISQEEYRRIENFNVIDASKDLEKWKHVEPFDFIISLMSFRSGLEMSEVSGCVTWHYIVLRASKEVHPYYYKWLFKCSQYCTALSRTCNFIRNGQDLRFSNFSKVPLPIPSLYEQKKIADYLNAKCAEIDALCADIQSEIENLETYKRSVISEAVTKGLDKNARIIKSRIFYMAPYNAEWKLSKIGYECKKLWRSFSPDDTPLLCTNKGKITIRPDEMLGRMVSEDHAMQGIRKGDIAIHGMDTWHGAIALSDYDGKITRVVHVCDSDNDKRFIVYYLQQLAFNGVYKLISNGIRGNTSDFRSWDKVADIYIALPNLEEQNKIANYLDAMSNDVGSIIDQKKEQLEILADYRKSVIYEYVTGKKEVPSV